ncbi:MAG TPA: c-type cytochrome domain-containing protein [Bryobacteraceae bacterium]|nr:c-type cytochrome domain-containing protein [Bryobacteraceae bacterium]
MNRIVVGLFALAPVAMAQKPVKNPGRFFDSRVAPILTKRCLACHNDELNDGGISFLDRDSLLQGGQRGPAIVPGDAGKSVLMQAVRQRGELRMPPGPKLPAKEIATLTQWIEAGALWGKKLRKKN